MKAHVLDGRKYLRKCWTTRPARFGLEQYWTRKELNLPISRICKESSSRSTPQHRQTMREMLRLASFALASELMGVDMSLTTSRVAYRRSVGPGEPLQLTTLTEVTASWLNSTKAETWLKARFAARVMAYRSRVLGLRAARSRAP